MMWDKMQKHPENLIRYNGDISKIYSGNYAFISDKTEQLMKASLDVNCQLHVLQEAFYPSGLGLVLPKDSPYTQEFSAM